MAEKIQKGVENVKRRTWDTAYFSKKAQLRASGQLNETKKVVASSKEECKPASKDAACPAGSSRAFLKARESKLDFESGKVELVKSDDAQQGPGYHCEVCDQSLKDSVAYIDHINGKKHQRKIGYSMRMERSTVEQVKERLKSKRKLQTDDATAIVLEKFQEKLKAPKIQQEEKEIVDEISGQEVDQDMMALLGFGGFGSSKK